MIVLHEIADNAAGSERAHVESFREEAAIIAKNVRRDQLDGGDGEGCDFHAGFYGVASQSHAGFIPARTCVVGSSPCALSKDPGPAARRAAGRALQKASPKPLTNVAPSPTTMNFVEAKSAKNLTLIG